MTIKENTELEKVPFIEVYIEHNDSKKDDPSFDPAKLACDYDILVVDSTTIEINVQFKFPQYVSASQPEDQLVVKFNGPFFDKEDGLDI